MIKEEDILVGAKFESKNGSMKVEINNIDEYSPGVPRIRIKMDGIDEVFADTLEDTVGFFNEEDLQKVTTIVSEALDMNKPELKKMIKDIFKDEFKKGMSVEKKKMIDSSDVQDIIRKMLKKYYRSLWEKSPLFIDNVKL